jgi:hypothetical protein
MSLGEFAELWGRSFGVTSKYLHVDPNGRWPYMPDFLKIDIEEGAAYISEFGFAGGDPTVIRPEEVCTGEYIDK